MKPKPKRCPDLRHTKNISSPKYGLPNKDLLIAASTSGRFGIALSILGTLFSQVEPVIRESNMFEYLFSLLPAQTDTFHDFFHHYCIYSWWHGLFHSSAHFLCTVTLALK